MNIAENISLRHFNTFGIDVTAAFFTEIFSLDELKEALEFAKAKEFPVLVLGGGSNVLFTQDFNGLVIKNSIGGINIIKEDGEQVYINVGGGVVWHEFVLFCLQHNYAGVENLALIPGCAGASPMQNIGAYGVEIKEVFYELNALNRFDLAEQKFNNTACEFGYRESVFKNKYKEQFVITDVTYRLNKTPHFKVEYGAIRQQLEKDNIKELTIQAIANAVIAIRSSKLPDPKVIGNAGSFFKNPSVLLPEFQMLKEKFPQVIAYPNHDGTMKIAAGWMIEQCGFKGMRRGDAGVHNKQALVLVNYGDAKGNEILQLCQEIQAIVFEKFSVEIMPEVNII
ncbi:MAG: UDP-N-acetylenolpyruvoylglucosamine reductase [Sphingobacteriales bacterium 41-5]|nr:MAG: UDP-N-acetylenolpyruvoylglucosamine reductase [Sphingobacteriales bacterium 41-5]